jgi:hypothetical protein
MNLLTYILATALVAIILVSPYLMYVFFNGNKELKATNSKLKSQLNNLKLIADSKKDFISQKTVLKILENPPKFKIDDKIENYKIIDIVFKNHSNFFNLFIAFLARATPFPTQVLYDYKVKDLSKINETLICSESKLLEIQKDEIKL